MIIDFNILEAYDRHLFILAKRYFHSEQDADITKIPHIDDRNAFREYEAVQPRLIQERIQKKVSDEKAFFARLRYHVDTPNAEGLLLDATVQNGDVIAAWIKQNCGEYLSGSNLDVAVDLCKFKLTWHKMVVPEPPPPPPPPPLKLSDNTDQLPIDAVPNYGHSLEQLKDLSRRQEAERKRANRKGHFSTSI